MGVVTYEHEHERHELEGAFNVYRSIVTITLGIDPKSCAEDVGEAIEELKLKVVGLEATVVELKARNAKQAENSRGTGHCLKETLDELDQVKAENERLRDENKTLREMTSTMR